MHMTKCKGFVAEEMKVNRMQGMTRGYGSDVEVLFPLSSTSGHIAVTIKFQNRGLELQKYHLIPQSKAPFLTLLSSQEVLD